MNLETYYTVKQPSTTFYIASNFSLKYFCLQGYKIRVELQIKGLSTIQKEKNYTKHKTFVKRNESQIYVTGFGHKFT